MHRDLEKTKVHSTSNIRKSLNRNSQVNTSPGLELKTYRENSYQNQPLIISLSKENHPQALQKPNPSKSQTILAEIKKDRIKPLFVLPSICIQLKMKLMP
jgi:hypothetical protein